MRIFRWLRSVFLAKDKLSIECTWIWLRRLKERLQEQSLTLPYQCCTEIAGRLLLFVLIILCKCPQFVAICLLNLDWIYCNFNLLTLTLLLCFHSSKNWRLGLWADGFYLKNNSVRYSQIARIWVMELKWKMYPACLYVCQKWSQEIDLSSEEIEVGMISVFPTFAQCLRPYCFLIPDQPGTQSLNCNSDTSFYVLQLFMFHLFFFFQGGRSTLVVLGLNGKKN